MRESAPGSQSSCQDNGDEMLSSNSRSGVVPDVDRPIALWVDDRPPEVYRLRDMLVNQGLIIKIAATSAEAKAEVRDQPYDLILVDLRLDEMDGISVAKYARQLIANKYRRSIHFGAVTNFKHEYGEHSQRELFTFIYEKSDLLNGKSKAFVEDCLFAAADSRIRAGYPELSKPPFLPHANPDSVSHVRCDVGYVLDVGGPQVRVRLWRRGNPLERTIRLFARSYLSNRGVTGTGQPFRIDTFQSRSDQALVTLVTPLYESSDRLTRRVARDVDLEQFLPTGD